MKSIYLKNFAATAMVVCISFLIIAMSLVGLGRSYLVQEVKNTLTMSAEEVTRILSASYTREEGFEHWSTGMMVSSIAKSTGSQILISDAEGSVVVCSDGYPICRHIGMQIPEGILDLGTEEDRFIRGSFLGGFFEEPKSLVWRSMEDSNGTCIGCVIVSRPDAEIFSSGKIPGVIAAGVAFGVLAVALSVSLLYSKLMARPLDEIAECSRRFARGDFSQRVKQVEEPSSEMGALIESFNKMADSLQSAESRRSEFIANISHELRTPMTTISGFADGILDGTIPREDEEKYLRSIRDETRRLSRLVRDMLDVSQMKARAADPSRREVFDICELLLQTLLSFESRATAKGLDVDPMMPDNSVMVRANKDAITQVIYNLIDNAVKFASPNTFLTVRLYKQDGKAYISIKDEGETIPPDDLPFIFDRFHKSDRSRSLDKDGVGLGLYLVKSIINGHDEDIGVKSENGSTEFVFTLSLAE
ncbi:MAG: HAMP domain-containing histidine kinase [Oscillospiraceae bacterium]|nr:HAMP domain-containing histidine kinase [Oscillospiraceae bacterium]